MRKVHNKTIIFHCPQDLADEIDAIAEANMIEQTDVVITAADKLVRFMEPSQVAACAQAGYSESIETYLEAMEEYKVEPLHPEANIIQPYPEGEVPEIPLLRRRKRK